ncbi:transcriptional repressor TCF25-domain-containing protein [Parasitella parasitica]|nr:transcriptional repressor TCF25-domain-containing protein [Parasitella parasitica]
MSSRALRRLQKEQIQDIVPKKDQETDEEPSNSEVDEEDVQDVLIKQINPFDLLNESDDGIEEVEEDDEDKKDIKELEPIIEKNHNKARKSKKKTKKRGNKNENSTTGNDDISMKELDKVLKQLGKTSPKGATDKQSLNTEESRQLLSVNYRNLDAQAEMKRLFGSHVVNSENRSSQGRVLKKSKFTTPKSDWPPYKRNGLSMEVVETKDGNSYYAFRHSEQYQDVQLEFLNAIATHNAEALLFLTRRHPYHVDSLLQLSEIAKDSGDWTAAGDFIERALYACERALHPQFSLSNGSARLSYKRSENRSFFLAVFRHIQFLTRRGCWKTAFEFNKLLFSLDPTSDPLGALLSLDYHALSSKDYDYVIKMQSQWKTDGNLYPSDLNNMPNFAYSSAYAKFKMGEKSKNSQDVIQGTKIMREAIQKYPLVYCRLLEKLGEPEADEIVQLTQYIPNEYMDIMQLSYIERTFEMWKEPEVLEWLKGVGSSTLPMVVSQPKKIQQKLLCDEKENVPLSVCRYIVLIDIQKLLSYLPPNITSSSYQMYDPLPPADSETMYDINERMRSSSTSFGRIPTDARGLMDMMRNMLGANQLPAGDQEQVRQLLGELERLRRENANQAPGAFPLDVEDFDADENDNEEVYDDGTEDNDDLGQIQHEMHNNGDMTADEVMEIMNAVGDEDLDVQRALAEAFERNNNNNNN